MERKQLLLVLVAVIVIAAAGFMFYKPGQGGDGSGFSLFGGAETGNVIDQGDVSDDVAGASQTNPFENTNPFGYDNPFE